MQSFLVNVSLAGNIPDSEAVFEWNEANGESAVTLADQLTLPEFVITGAYYKNTCRFANPIPDMGMNMVLF